MTKPDSSLRDMLAVISKDADGEATRRACTHLRLTEYWDAYAIERAKFENSAHEAAISSDSVEAVLFGASPSETQTVYNPASRAWHAVGE